jgi:hypothetical protein
MVELKLNLPQTYKVLDALLQGCQEEKDFIIIIKSNLIRKALRKFTYYQVKNNYYVHDATIEIKRIGNEYNLFEPTNPSGKVLRLTKNGREAKKINDFPKFIKWHNNPPMTEFQKQSLENTGDANKLKAIAIITTIILAAITFYFR